MLLLLLLLLLLPPGGVVSRSCDALCLSRCCDALCLTRSGSVALPATPRHGCASLAWRRLHTHSAPVRDHISGIHANAGTGIL